MLTQSQGSTKVVDETQFGKWTRAHLDDVICFFPLSLFSNFHQVPFLLLSIIYQLK